jgi:hypothetical protein
MPKVSILTVFFTLICLTGLGWADVSLSVTPVDGSSTLRLGTVQANDNKQEIHIRVNSNGSRYQVFERIAEPIMDNQGNTVNLQAVEAQTLPNSNSYGTLYLQNTSALSMGDQLLYSSSQSGQGDSFIVGYSVNQNLINAGGKFRGRMVFTVRGMGDASSDQATIDVFIETSPSLQVVVKGAHNPRRIRIKSSDTSEKSADYINISFSGNSGQEVRIYQEMEGMPQNTSAQQLSNGVLQMDAQAQTEGLRIAGLSSLNPNRTLIYSSNKSEDNILLYFLVDADQIQKQAAGTYTGKIHYVVETDRAKQEFPIDLQCEVPPIFSINITPPVGGVNFSHLLPSSPPQDKEVTITVFSNLNRPYQVLQEFQTNMTNTQGKEFNNKYFTVQVAIPVGQKGQTNLTEFSPVRTGEYPIFSSDAAGSGATFEVIYRLQGYAQMDSGDFTAPVRFSLNQK